MLGSSSVRKYFYVGFLQYVKLSHMIFLRGKITQKKENNASENVSVPH